MSTKLQKYFNYPSDFFYRETIVNPMEKILDEMLNSSFPELSKEVGVDFFGNSAYPKVDVIEHSDRVEIIAEIPGLKKENLNLVIENGMLTISGEKSEREVSKDAKYIFKELKKSKFKRSFNIDEDKLDSKTVDAKFEDGVLTITLKRKTVEPKPSNTKKIEIK